MREQDETKTKYSAPQSLRNVKHSSFSVFGALQDILHKKHQSGNYVPKWWVDLTWHGRRSLTIKSLHPKIWSKTLSDKNWKMQCIITQPFNMSCLTVRIIALVSGFYSSEHRIGLVPFTDIHVIYYIKVNQIFALVFWKIEDTKNSFWN